MNIATRIDLQTIYENQIKPAELFKKFAQAVEFLESTYSQRARLRTRKADNKILASSSINLLATKLGGRGRLLASYNRDSSLSAKGISS